LQFAVGTITPACACNTQIFFKALPMQLKLLKYFNLIIAELFLELDKVSPFSTT
jgi:hypothetical protein